MVLFAHDLAKYFIFYRFATWHGNAKTLATIQKRTKILANDKLVGLVLDTNKTYPDYVKLVLHVSDTWFTAGTCDCDALLTLVHSIKISVLVVG
jgi:hypothetical protein